MFEREDREPRCLRQAGTTAHEARNAARRQGCTAPPATWNSRHPCRDIDPAIPIAQYRTGRREIASQSDLKAALRRAAIAQGGW